VARAAFARRMRALARRAALAAACALVAACSSWPLVRTDRQESPDASLEMVIVVREAADKRQEATHEVFVDIDRPRENKGRFLHEEYRYLLKGSLVWRVVWHSNEMVTLHILEIPAQGASGEPRDVAVLVFVREPNGMFHPLRTEEESRREVA